MRVPRTFVFVDLSGFTNYTAAFGDDAAGRLGVLVDPLDDHTVVQRAEFHSHINITPF